MGTNERRKHLKEKKYHQGARSKTYLHTARTSNPSSQNCSRSQSHLAIMMLITACGTSKSDTYTSATVSIVQRGDGKGIADSILG
jgi:hypothetical protein